MFIVSLCSIMSCINVSLDSQECFCGYFPLRLSMKIFFSQFPTISRGIKRFNAPTCSKALNRHYQLPQKSFTGTEKRRRVKWLKIQSRSFWSKRLLQFSLCMLSEADRRRIETIVRCEMKVIAVNCINRYARRLTLERSELSIRPTSNKFSFALL
jgi:hypothetical protein